LTGGFDVLVSGLDPLATARPLRRDVGHGGAGVVVGGGGGCRGGGRCLCC
jgi:hypothetical protein